MNQYIRNSIEVKPGSKVGGDILVEFTIENISDKDLLFLKWNTPFEGLQSNIFKILKNKHYRLPYDGKLVKRGQPGREDYILLKKGETLKTKLDLSEAYHFKKDGEYEVALDTYGIDFIELEDEDQALLKNLEAQHEQQFFKLKTEKKTFFVTIGTKESRKTKGMQQRLKEFGKTSISRK